MRTLNIWAANSEITTLSTLVKVKNLIGCYYTIIQYFEVESCQLDEILFHLIDEE